MKYRNNFITNSSSSSFIVSTPKSNKENFEHFFEAAENLGGYETDEPHAFTTEKELNEYVKEEYDCSLPELLKSDDTYYQEIYGTILKAIREGKIVIKQDVSYGQEELYTVLLRYILQNYEILDQEG